MFSSRRSDTLFARGIKISHLRMIAGLQETGQIGLAAEKLGITQPAASRLLAELERIVGHPVHLRDGRGVSLTATGQILARRSQRMLMEMNDAAREMAELSVGGSGHVGIGAVTAPALDMVLPALRTARLSHPGIRAEVVVATSDILCGQLLAGRLDFALARVPQGMDPTQFTARMIAPEPVALVVRRAHQLAQRQAVDPIDLMQYDWVMPGQDSLLGAAVMLRLAALGLPPPQQRLSTASFLLTLALLQQTNSIAPLALAVAHQFATGPDAPFAVLQVDLGISVAPYGLLTRAGASLTSAANILVDLIMNTAPA
jgi:DNA-binding transcriptional LysR family regulator